MSLFTYAAIAPRRLPWLDRGRLREALSEDGPAIGLIALHCVVVLGITDLSVREFALQVPGALLMVAVMTLGTAIAVRAWQYRRTVKPASPIRQLCVDAAAVLRNGGFERWLPLAGALSCFFVTFSHLKASIPALTGGFQWDRTFFELDRWLHGGRSPWEWLQPVLGHAPVTFVLNLNYSLWFSLMWGLFFFYKTMTADRVGRLRFILCFVLLWSVGGGLFATMLSSAGPCYYELLVAGENPYAPLMAYLHQADVHWLTTALDIQKILWLDHENEGRLLGISAMPSLHNGIAMLMVLGSRRFGRRLHLAFVVHAVMVYLGSIHLAWHYAVDAYMSWALAVLFWIAAKPVAVRWDRRRAGDRLDQPRPLPARLCNVRS